MASSALRFNLVLLLQWQTDTRLIVRVWQRIVDEKGERGGEEDDVCVHLVRRSDLQYLAEIEHKVG